MKFEQFTFSVDANQAETLAALLVDDFDGFEERVGQLLAYRQVSSIPFSLDEWTSTYLNDHQITFARELVEDKDWNQVWESEFEPITIGHELFIGAEHHRPEDDFAFVITLQPRMAFGTGHHPTTFLMAQKMLDLDLGSKRVLDFGAGTGVLAILAKMKDADFVRAIDNDPKCTDNMRANFELNRITGITPELGDVDLINGDVFDVILANITRNIITDRLSHFAACLSPKGLLLCSGFFESDASEIERLAQTFGLTVRERQSKDQWSQITFEKVN